MTEKIPCPFVYANGKACTGHIVKIETFKANLEWELKDDGTWGFDFYPLTHYHVYCSEKSNHAGFSRPDSDQLKFYTEQLPDEVAAVVCRDLHP